MVELDRVESEGIHTGVICGFRVLAGRRLTWMGKGVFGRPAPSGGGGDGGGQELS